MKTPTRKTARKPAPVRIFSQPRPIFITAFIIALVLWCAAMCIGCGPKSRPNYTLSPVGGIDSAGPFHVSYHSDFDDDVSAANDLVPSDDERRLYLARCLVVLADYERENNWKCPAVYLRIYPKLISGVPCGIPNGGGCFSPLTGSPFGTIYVIGNLEPLYHELNHHRLWLQGQPLWYQHGGKEWEKVWKYVPPWKH